MTMGSVHYFSPEQARGEPVTTASDIYSAGLVLYEMLTAQRAFSGDSAAAVAMARLTGRIPSPLQVRPDVPMALDAIVRWTLQPDPRARPTAAELSAALGRFLADPHGTSGYMAAPPPPPPPVRPTSLYAMPPEPERGSDRLGWVAALVGLFVLVAAGVLLFLVIAWGASGPRATPTPGPTPGPTPSAHATPTPTPAAVRLPSFVGLGLDEARAFTDEHDIQLLVSYQATTAADPETVLSQEPPAGRNIRPGGNLSVVVAQEPNTVIVPELRGQTEEDAVATLLEAGLTFGGHAQVYNPNVPVGLVVRSDPRAGVAVARETAVELQLSRGPRPTTAPTVTPSPSPTPTPTPTPKPTRTPRPTRKPTPEPSDTPGPAATPVVVGNYQCLDLATAEGQIESSGLTVGAVSPSSPPRDDSWQVTLQVPPAGTLVDPGASVDLEVVDPGDPCP